MEVQVDANRKPIVLEGLSSLVDTLCNNSTEDDTPASKHFYYVCTFIPCDTEMKGYGKLVWAHSDKKYQGENPVLSLEMLRSYQYSNDLDSMIDYTGVLCCPRDCILGVLECVRKGVNPERKIHFKFSDVVTVFAEP